MKISIQITGIAKYIDKPFTARLELEGDMLGDVETQGWIVRNQNRIFALTHRAELAAIAKANLPPCEP